MTRTGANTYQFTVPHSDTAMWEVGPYTMEVLDKTGFCIYKKKDAFNLEDSASKCQKLGLVFSDKSSQTITSPTRLQMRSRLTP